ncbi:hypothetical protein DRE_03524 [Drechslerella stenobrocha 248]|uniref:GH16 domain-containing protein n=1 Tax=Drechslerella stenobrocha 248 TaxID=1043628 RepID=W7IDU6_9PEZI|nr:hypothetical protein DRE_03524 [Drechslerella stenobrocha 248]
MNFKARLFVYLTLSVVTAQSGLLGLPPGTSQPYQPLGPRQNTNAAAANCACGYYIPETKLTFTHRLTLNPATLQASDLARGLYRQGWRIDQYKLNSSPKAIYYAASNVRLNTRAKTLDLYVSGGPANRPVVRSAEITTLLENIRYGSFRFNVKASAVPGTCHGMFLYKDDNNEIDIEILTSYLRQTGKPQGAGTPDPGLQLTIQKLRKNQPQANYKVVPFDDRTDPTNGFHDYRFDWTSTGVNYFFNQKLYGFSRYIPQAGGSVIVNNWSNGDICKLIPGHIFR